MAEEEEIQAFLEIMSWQTSSVKDILGFAGKWSVGTTNLHTRSMRAARGNTHAVRLALTPGWSFLTPF